MNSIFWYGFKENANQIMGAVLQTAAKIRSWGGHLELHAISEAYKVNGHAVHV